MNYADQGHNWTAGFGDITLALKREMFSSLRTGSILSLQGGILLPTGDSKRGFGAGTTQFEPFAAFDQLFKENTFLQTQLGADLPVDTSVAPRSMFWRVTVGQAMAPGPHVGTAVFAHGRVSGGARFQSRCRHQLGCSARDADHHKPQATRSHGLRGEGAIHEHAGPNPTGVVLSALGSGGRESYGKVGDETPMEYCDSLWVSRWLGFQQSCAARRRLENAKGDKTPPGTFFRTSERCVACHNGLKTSSGEDISIGLEWSASIMANSSRDPSWQGSVRRESMDDPESKQVIEDECSICHMPAVRMSDRDAGRHTQVFSRLPLQKFPNGDRAAADGVTCSVCHQIEKTGLGTDATFVGNVVLCPRQEKHTMHKRAGLNPKFRLSILGGDLWPYLTVEVS